jgi:hypothetical protein
LRKEKPEGIRCPSCEAPYRETIPNGAIKLKCKYCGGVFVPDILNKTINRCVNHPDIIAAGKCNDCGENFCEQCLSVYDLIDNTFTNEQVKLYLCPDCLKRRYASRANAGILGGGLVLAVGVLALAVFAPVAPLVALVPMAFTVLLGVGFLSYGFWEMGKVSGENTIESLRIQNERRQEEEERSASFDLEAENAYDRLIAYYVNHWGASEGLSLLETEIAAYVRSGASYSQAVMKVYERQKHKSPPRG